MQYNAGMGGYIHDGEINDYDNPKVKKIRVELGDFSYDEAPDLSNLQLEYKDLIELENHARYDGEWIKNT